MDHLLTQQSDKTIYFRKEVSLATGVGEATIAHVVFEFNKTRKVILSNQGHQSPRKFQAKYLEAIHNLIISANKNSIPLSLSLRII
ncbi:3428_t:CDS:2 [Gigaspora rosea]|nr:3428_t:CDS:2 [Gigaspora rosea]